MFDEHIQYTYSTRIVRIISGRCGEAIAWNNDERSFVWSRSNRSRTQPRWPSDIKVSCAERSTTLAGCNAAGTPNGPETIAAEQRAWNRRTHPHGCHPQSPRMRSPTPGSDPLCLTTRRTSTPTREPLFFFFFFFFFYRSILRALDSFRKEKTKPRTVR